MTMFTPNEERLLEALEAVAPPEPINQDEQGGCVHCGWRSPRGMYATSSPKHHHPDCAWISARALINELRS